MNFLRIACAASLAVAVCGAAQAKTIALLVGISNYQDPALRLNGPENDIPSVKGLLEQKLGVAEPDIHVLLDANASGARIRQELIALKSRSAPGDTVVVYFSGHGTSARDALGKSANLPYGTGAFFPYDGQRHAGAGNTLIVGRTDVRPVFEALDQGGRSVIFWIDACYSGNTVRAVTPFEPHALQSRFVPFDTSNDAFSVASADQFKAEPEVYPYKNVVMLSASSDAEAASDTDSKTLDGKPHGAFTDALLRVYQNPQSADLNGDGKISFSELREAVASQLASRAYPQTPQLLPGNNDSASSLRFASVPGLDHTPPSSGVVRSEPVSVLVEESAQSIKDQVLAETGAKLGAPGQADLRLAQVGKNLRLMSPAGDIILESADIDGVVERIRAQAWLKSLPGSAHAANQVSLETNPSFRGGNFVIHRDQFQFITLTDQPAFVVLIDVFPNGELHMLSPLSASELTVNPGKSPLNYPAYPMRAVPPAGVDHVIAFAFPKVPEGLTAFYKLNSRFSGQAARSFVQWLKSTDQPYALSGIDVRTIDKRP